MTRPSNTHTLLQRLSLFAPTGSRVTRSSLDEETLFSCSAEPHEPGSTIRPGQLEKPTQPGLLTGMAVTRSSCTPSSTSDSKNVKPCHVHNEPPPNSFKPISIEPRTQRYYFRHLKRRGTGQGATLHSAAARPTRSYKKLPAIPINSAVDLSQARSRRRNKSNLFQHCERSFKPIHKYRAKCRMGNLKKLDMTHVRSANKTLDRLESRNGADRGSPYEMKRNAALAAAAIQANHYFIENFEDQ
ncbi:hypothetical protein FCOIX_5620 [Fusarium coicis]|nr:hypothetical protein FCOIX_5620 [Fusarium coicis]